MTWKLFLDDERIPVDDSFVIARSSTEATNLIIERGMPVHIAFDHDLVDEDTSIKFIWLFIDMVLDERISIPPDFTFSIHSQNPIGSENIKVLMTGFLSSECGLHNRFNK